MSSFAGQWMGFSEGDPPGRVMCDCEVRNGIEKAVAYLFSGSSEIPSTVTEFEFPDAQDKFDIEVTIHPFDTSRGRIIEPNELPILFPEANFSNSASIGFERLGLDALKIGWSTDIGTYGRAVLSRSRIPTSSTLPSDPNVGSWRAFKEVIADFKFSDFVFRGQARRYPLQSSFHRTRRKILHFYLKYDVPSLHRSITGKTRHLFDLERPQQFGAFLNLAQHHGYPTPLLDWTYSPYVAAWFAYRDALRSSNDEEPVRILCLDRKEYSLIDQFQNLTFAPPHFSILEALAIENNRAIPQQGLHTLTNVQDVETYLKELEDFNGKTYLIALDLPREEASVALNELAMMGITRSTMFPSIESICLDARDRMF